MSFEVDVAKRLGEAELRFAFASDARLTAIVGPSGVGKTSLLNMIAGLLRPDAGRIVVAGETVFAADRDVPPERRRAGYVFQDLRLFPHMSVRANLAYGRRAGPALLTLEEAARLLDIADLLDRRPVTLSGGEAKRVAIGRALLSNPRFLLLDEPLASLDAARAESVLGAIERVRDEVGLPILYVSHEAREVTRLADRTVELSR